MTIAIVSPQQLIYRAARSKGWIRDGKVSPGAYLLKPKDEGKLSVITQANCTANICSATLNDCFGEIILTIKAITEVGEENELNLTVIEDPLPENPYHAAILNLPPPDDETLARAEFIAGELAKRATINNRPKF